MSAVIAPVPEIAPVSQIAPVPVWEIKIDAIKARKEAEVKYGYHENHGRMKSGD